MDAIKIRKRRSDRLHQLRQRGGRVSITTELENARIVAAWEAGELTEGQAALALGVDRLDARRIRDEVIKAGISLAAALRAKAVDNVEAAVVP